MKLSPAAAIATSLLLSGNAAQNLSPHMIDQLNGTARAIELEDLNGDGVPEVLLGDSSDNNNTGRITIVDGQSRQPLGGPWPASMLVGLTTGSLFGWSMDLGDLDCDGKIDLLVGAPGANAAVILWGDVRPVTVISGPQFSEFGHDVSIGGDIDGDGKNDAVIGAPKEDRLGWPDAGAVYVLYGGRLQLTRLIRGGAVAELRGWCVNGPEDYDGNPANALEILESTFRYLNGAGAIGFFDAITGRSRGGMSGTPGEGLGFFSQSVGDIDGDGRHDVYAGSPFYSGTQPSEGRVGVYSIPLGAAVALHLIASGRADMQLGLSGAVSPAILGGLILLAGASGSRNNEGAVWCYDPLYNRKVCEFWGTNPGEAVGSDVAFMDANQDGVDDVVFTGNVLYIQSIAPLELRTDLTEVSVQTGGAIHYQVVKPQAANHAVFMLGTSAGIAPGFNLFGVHFSINPSAYTFVQPNALFTALAGALDANGQWSTTLQIPALPVTSFPPFSLHHLALTWDPAQGVAASIDRTAPHVARLVF